MLLLGSNALRTPLAPAGLLTASLLFGGCSGGDDAAEPVLGPAPNSAPIIESAASASVESGAVVVLEVSASDAEADALSFEISGGADAGQFELSGNVVQFIEPPDVSAPMDSDGDNRYEITLSVSDGQASTAQDLVIEVIGVTASTVSVRRLASDFNQPLFVTGSGDGSGRLLVIEKTGLIRILDPATGAINPVPLLDLSTSITTDGERGLLGLALAPDFADSGQFYVNVTNLEGDTEIRRYELSAADPDQASLSSGDVILTFAQLASNHNGGWIGFGDDGFLYVASGDGGGAGDPGNHGQDSSTLLGAILRIDPSTDDFPDDPDRDYAVPTDNPFSNAGGAAEVFAYGLRNPFRASFDSATGDLYIGDVGQGAVEEIDLVPRAVPGLNFGWNLLEGTEEFAGSAAAGLRAPIAQYFHGSGPLQGNSVTGGIVYRGPVVQLRGEYLFGDFVSNNIFSFNVDGIDSNPTVTLSAAEFQIRTEEFEPDVGSIDGLTSFGEDDNGDVYLTDIDGDVFVIEEG